MAFSTYDPNEVLVTWGGVPIEGFADGSFITVEANEDLWSLQVGSGGESARSKSNNSSGRITISLLSTAATNNRLMLSYNADKIMGGIVFPLAVFEPSGGMVLMASNAWITRLPTYDFDKEANNRDWVFESDTIVIQGLEGVVPFVGG